MITRVCLWCMQLESSGCSCGHTTPCQVPQGWEGGYVTLALSVGSQNLIRLLTCCRWCNKETCTRKLNYCLLTIRVSVIVGICLSLSHLRGALLINAYIWQRVPFTLLLYISMWDLCNLETQGLLKVVTTHVPWGHTTMNSGFLHRSHWSKLMHSPKGLFLLPPITGPSYSQLFCAHRALSL